MILRQLVLIQTQNLDDYVFFALFHVLKNLQRILTLFRMRLFGAAPHRWMRGKALP